MTQPHITRTWLHYGQSIVLVLFPNGVERVIVPQLARSFGVFFTESESKGNKYFGAKIIPARGVWIEIESESDGGIYIRIDKKRKFPAMSLLRAMGYETNEMILKAFAGNSIAEEIIKASEGNMESYAASKKNEAENKKFFHFKFFLIVCINI